MGGSQAGAEGRQVKGWQLRQVSAPSSFTLNSGAEVEAAPTSSALGSTSTRRWGGGSEQTVPRSSGGLCPPQCGRWLGIPQVWLGQPLGQGCLGSVSRASPAPCTAGRVNQLCVCVCVCVCVHPTPRWSLTHHMSPQSDTVPDAHRHPGDIHWMESMYPARALLALQGWRHGPKKGTLEQGSFLGGK